MFCFLLPLVAAGSVSCCVFFGALGSFVLSVQPGWAIFVNFGKELLLGNPFAVWGYDTWRFLKCSVELAPRSGSLGLRWSILARNHPNTLWIARYHTPLYGITRLR